MPRPRLVFDSTAQHHLHTGINLVADLLAPTLGPVRGAVAHQQSGRGTPELLDDSAIILRRIVAVTDRDADVGVMLMRGVIWRLGQRVGDGGTTAAVLMRALYNDALRLMSAGADFTQLRRGIERGVEAVTAALNRQSRPVTTEDDLARAALTLVGQRDLAAVLGEICYILGADGQVNIEKYVAPVLRHNYIEGCRYPAEVPSAYLYSEAGERRTVVTNAAVALVDDTLREAESVIPLLEAALESGVSALCIVATQYEEKAITTLITNRDKLKDRLAVAVTRIRLKPDQRMTSLHDLALLTGAVPIGANYGLLPANVRPEHLGYATRVEATSQTLHLTTRNHGQAAVRETVAELRDSLAGMLLDHERRPALAERLAALRGSACRLQIGAHTQAERDVLTDAATRAIKVLSAAQRSGVVAGGGAALHHSRAALDTLRFDDDADLGVQVLARALSMPLRQIIRNAHRDDEGLILEELAQAGCGAAFDAVSQRVVDAHAGGILDVTAVLTQVIECAVSGAIMALSTDAIVYHKKPEVSVQP